MRLVLVRHAVAVERAAGSKDEARPLTPDGRRRFRQVVKGLKRLGVELDRLHHSPWTRAVETADLLMPLVNGESVVDARLARPPDEALLAALAGRRVGAVGHRPWIGELLAWLCFGSRAAAEGLDFAKGGVAFLDGEPRPGGMRLAAFLPPSALRRLR